MKFKEAINFGSLIILKHEYGQWKGNPEDDMTEGLSSLVKHWVLHKFAR
jgi:hypothetical protein